MDRQERDASRASDTGRMKFLYCFRCKAFKEMSPSEKNCDDCKREVAEELRKKGSW